MWSLGDRLQISPPILIEFKWINFYSPWKYKKTVGFLMISRRAEVNYFADNYHLLTSILEHQNTKSNKKALSKKNFSE